MMGFKNWIQIKRYGGQTGLNEMGNNAKMTAIIAGPLLVAWIVIQMIFPLEYIQLGTLLTFGGWGAYCVLIYSWAKADASSYRAFPQMVMRFPDGGVRVFNVLVPPDGFTKICVFKDGSVGYHVDFSEKCQYWTKDMSFPYVFGGAFFKIPDVWDKAFGFKSAGEFFHKGIAIDHPACENISAYVVTWHRTASGEIEPICLVNDCSLAYEEFLANSKKIPIGEIRVAERMFALWKKGRLKEMELTEQCALYEDTIGTMEKNAVDFRKEVDRTLETVRAKVHDVMSTKEPLLKRIFNFKNLLKAILILSLMVFLYAIVKTLFVV